MRRLFYALCLVGAAVPIILTCIVLICLAILDGITRPLRMAHMGVEIGLALGMMLTVAYFARRIWAGWAAVAVSACWLYMAAWTIFDVRSHPQRWQNGDGAESVLILLPCGTIGFCGAAVVLLKVWRERKAAKTEAESEEASNIAQTSR